MTQQKGQGLIIVYTGTGKGKTTAALGLALRAIGQKMKVLMIQFLKNAEYGEHLSVKKLAPLFEIKVMGSGFCGIEGDKKPREEHRKKAQEALKLAAQAVSSQDYHLVILDEINCALATGLIEWEDIEKLVTTKPPFLHLVFTGRGAPRELIGLADLVTDMQELKHPFQAGFKAQKGIEY